jgi:hypothetical protein
MITVLHQTLTDMLSCNLGYPFLDQLRKHIVLKDFDHNMALYNFTMIPVLLFQFLILNR